MNGKVFKTFADSKVCIPSREFGSNGNAFALMGKFQQEAKRQNFTEEEVKAVLADAMTSNYDHLLQTLTQYIDFDEPEDDDEDDE